MKKIGFLLCTFFFIVMSVGASTETLVVVWTQTDSVHIWQNGETHVISVEGKYSPTLSPNAERVMLMPVTGEFPQYFLTIRLDGTERQRFDVPYPNQVLWQSDSVLWANSYMPNTNPESDFVLQLSNLLYRINIETGQIDQWEMDSPFTMTINPTGDFMAIVHAGVYQQTEGRIRLIALTQDTPTPQEVLRFPAISSGTHIGYFPMVQWISPTMARVAIIAPDTLYAEWTEPLPMALWQITTDGTSEKMGEVGGNFMSYALWSGDGASLLYSTTVPPNYELRVASVEGQAIYLDQAMELPVSIAASYVLFAYPIPKSDTFLLLDNNILELINRDMPLRSWLTTESRVLGMKVRAQGVVFVLFEREASLVYAKFGDENIYEIVKISEYPFFDAKWD